MLKIGLKKQLDLETYRDFYNLNIGGVDFGAKILRDHPHITPEIAESYIANYYNEHHDELAHAVTETTKRLESVQQSFFQYLDTVFEMNFESETYQGFMSIFDCNPRFVETGEFQIFYKRVTEDKLSVIFHEVLHFAFFKYCDTKLAKQTGNLDKNSGALWKFSEVFNVIIMNQPEFQSFFSREEKLFYPNLKSVMGDLQSLWQNNNIDQFVVKGLERLK